MAEVGYTVFIQLLIGIAANALWYMFLNYIDKRWEKEKPGEEPSPIEINGKIGGKPIEKRPLRIVSGPKYTGPDVGPPPLELSPPDEPPPDDDSESIDKLHGLPTKIKKKREEMSHD